MCYLETGQIRTKTLLYKILKNKNEEKKKTNKLKKKLINKKTKMKKKVTN